MRIGLVCPYSFDVPGGVQFHIRDLAESLHQRGHHVSILAPADEDAPLPPFVVSSGKALPVRYNGSVARLTFGPTSAGRVARWVEQGAFDVVHIHEPIAPSVSVLALWAVEGPIVATFHTSLVRSRAMQAAYPLVRASLEKIHGRIAVSEAARHTVITHMGGDAVVIPNGVFTGRFAQAVVRPEWQGTTEAPTIAFLGRIDEPRKGLPVLSQALGEIITQIPGVRVLVAGYGDIDTAVERLDLDVRDNVHFLGSITEEEKASLLASVDLYVAPHTGGESFGIVLVEAMSAGAPVLASDISAFAQVLDGGRVGALFPNGDAAALAREAVALLRDPARREALSEAASLWCRRFDWDSVSDDIIAVYETVIEGVPEPGAPDARGPREWLRRRRERRGQS
ncbi:MAG: glycosyltransferase family 4 protein [Dermatophilus congolensis]|nr:glycosyltransferase family 4 protein [Dermatophilus congolensis]